MYRALLLTIRHPVGERIIISKNHLRLLIIFVIFATIILYALDISGYFGRNYTNTGELKGVEIQNYNGEDLSKISDFRENSIKGTQRIAEDDYRLKVTGLVNSPAEYTYNEIISGFKSYKKVVTLNCVEGWDVTILWEGILIKDIIEPSQILPSANTVIFTANDGYTTSFPLEYLTERNIIMAYSINNVTLPAERGYPFMLVAEDKWGYKWIKWITQIELSDDENYRGYWEMRGYSDSGDLNKGFFD